MTVTPMMMPKRRIDHAAAPMRPVYSTSTGDAPRPVFRETVDTRPLWDEAHCFVCHRHTDHFGEHDELVEAGLAEYDAATLSVRRTEKWDEDLAREIRENAYAAYAVFLRDDLRV